MLGKFGRGLEHGCEQRLAVVNLPLEPPVLLRYTSSGVRLYGQRSDVSATSMGPL
jgi:hypothetical protein